MLPSPIRPALEYQLIQAGIIRQMSKKVGKKYCCMILYDFFSLWIHTSYINKGYTLLLCKTQISWQVCDPSTKLHYSVTKWMTMPLSWLSMGMACHIPGVAWTGTRYGGDPWYRAATATRRATRTTTSSASTFSVFFRSGRPGCGWNINCLRATQPHPASLAWIRDICGTWQGACKCLF